MLKISDAKYYMEGKMLGRAITSTINAPVLGNDDNFRITVELSKIEGIDDNGFGIIWGSKDENNEYEFVISGNGQFKVIEWRDGTKKDLIAWTSYSNISKWDNATNILKIEKNGTLIKFFINDNYVAITKAKQNMGNKIGFVVNETMKVSFNYLVYERIEKTNIQNSVTDYTVISSAKFIGTNESINLKYDESIILKIVLENNSDFPAKDLAVIISSSNKKSIEFDPINMIEHIPAMEKHIVSVMIKAGEDVETLSRNFTITLSNGNGAIIDTKVVHLKTTGKYNYYSENTKTQNSTNSNTSIPTNSNDGCSKGCSYITLGALIVTLVLAIVN